MAKPEWGQKRTCQSCGCRFYDMTRTPLVCPKCGANVEPEVTFKVRRGGSAPAEPKVAAPVVIDPAIAKIEAEDLVAVDDEEEVLAGADDGAEDDESGLIEDASDLGEDDDDMAEVMEHMDEEIEDEV
ncbi:MAG: TIGR02300 family protein [Magnetospirillum sp.]|nr:MAG: TIGR02300 family protein [Magnetospirillum sp.]